MWDDIKNRAFWKDSAFWIALITIAFVIAAAAWPDKQDTFNALIAPVTALIVSILGKSAVEQVTALKYGYKREKGDWIKRTEPPAKLPAPTAEQPAKTHL